MQMVKWCREKTNQKCIFIVMLDVELIVQQTYEHDVFVCTNIRFIFPKSKIHVCEMQHRAVEVAFIGNMCKCTHKFFRIAACIEHNHYSQHSMQHKSQANYFDVSFSHRRRKNGNVLISNICIYNEVLDNDEILLFFLWVYISNNRHFWRTTRRNATQGKSFLDLDVTPDGKLKYWTFSLKKAISSCVLCFYRTVS